VSEQVKCPLHWSWISVLPKCSVSFSLVFIWPNHVTFGLVNTAIWVIIAVCTVWREDILGTYPKVFKATISFKMSTHLQYNSAPTEQIWWKLLLGTSIKICPEKSSLVKTEQIYHAIYLETWTHFYNCCELSTTVGQI
jgi:hypothetical protein